MKNVNPPITMQSVFNDIVNHRVTMTNMVVLFRLTEVVADAYRDIVPLAFARTYLEHRAWGSPDLDGDAEYMLMNQAAYSMIQHLASAAEATNPDTTGMDYLPGDVVSLETHMGYWTVTERDENGIYTIVPTSGTISVTLCRASDIMEKVN